MPLMGAAAVERLAGLRFDRRLQPREQVRPHALSHRRCRRAGRVRSQLPLTVVVGLRLSRRHQKRFQQRHLPVLVEVGRDIGDGPRQIVAEAGEVRLAARFGRRHDDAVRPGQPIDERRTRRRTIDDRQRPLALREPSASSRAETSLPRRLKFAARPSNVPCPISTIHNGRPASSCSSGEHCLKPVPIRRLACGFVVIPTNDGHGRPSPGRRSPTGPPTPRSSRILLRSPGTDHQHDRRFDSGVPSSDSDAAACTLTSTPNQQHHDQRTTDNGPRTLLMATPAHAARPIRRSDTAARAETSTSDATTASATSPSTAPCARQRSRRTRPVRRPRPLRPRRFGERLHSGLCCRRSCETRRRPGRSSSPATTCRNSPDVIRLRDVHPICAGFRGAYSPQTVRLRPATARRQPRSADRPAGEPAR